MKTSRGGGWKAVAIGSALAAPWLIGSALSDRSTNTGSIPGHEASAVHETRGARENGKRQRESSCTYLPREVLSAGDFEKL